MCVCVCVCMKSLVGGGDDGGNGSCLKNKNKTENTPIKKVRKGGFFGATNIYFRQLVQKQLIRLQQEHAARSEGCFSLRKG